MVKDYMITEKGRLGLGYKTMITRVTKDKNGRFDFETKQGDLTVGLDIYLWAEDFSHRWTIASFEFDSKEGCFELHECGDRLCDTNINWNDFGELVGLAHAMLAKVEEEWRDSHY